MKLVFQRRGTTIRKALAAAAVTIVALTLALATLAGVALAAGGHPGGNVRGGHSHGGGDILETIGGATLPFVGIPLLPVAFALVAVLALGADFRRSQHRSG